MSNLNSKFWGFLVLFSCLVFLESGCGKNKQASTQDALHDHGHDHGNESVEVQCSNPSDPKGCLNSVGMVVAQDADSPKPTICTGFLVDSSDILVTSARCVSENLRKNGCTNSQSSFEVSFQSSQGSGATKAQCKQLISVSSPSGSDAYASPDFAIVQLDKKLPFEPLNFDVSGLSDREHVSVVKMDLSSLNHLMGEIHSEDCQLLRNSMILPVFQDNHSPVGLLVGCQASPENAGAPVIDSNGNVVGIYQGQKIEPLAMFPASDKSMLPGVMDAFSFVTNLSCIHDFVSGTPPAACATQLSLSEWYKILGSGPTKDDQLAAAEALKSQFQKWAQENSSHVQWKIDGVTGDLRPTPVCFRDLNQWINQDRYRAFCFLSFCWGYKTDPVAEPFHSMAWKGEFHLNSGLAREYQVSEMAAESAKMSFIPNNLYEKKSSQLKIQTLNLDGSPKDLIFDHEIPVCPSRPAASIL